MIRLLSFACLFLANALTAAVFAATEVPIEAYDSREVALLPRYCIHTQLFRDHVPGGNNPAEISRLNAMLGPTFFALHHYCWGLMQTNRALLQAKTKQTRNFYLGTSIQEFDYVIQRAPSDFLLLPEILTKKGENLVRLGNGPLGVRELQRAIELKPDYWPPYVALSDYYKDIGDVAKSREVLETALTFAPQATPVKKRLASLTNAQKHGPVQR